MKSSLQHCTHVSSQSHKSSSPFLFFLTQLIAFKRVCSLFLYNLLLYSLDWKNIQKRIQNPTQIICVQMHASFFAFHVQEWTKRYLKYSVVHGYLFLIINGHRTHTLFASNYFWDAYSHAFYLAIKWASGSITY